MSDTTLPIGTTKYYIGGQEVPPPAPPTPLEQIVGLLQQIVGLQREAVFSLAEIRDALKPPPLPAVPYEQLAAAMDAPPYDPLAPLRKAAREREAARFDGPTAATPYTEQAPPLQSSPSGDFAWMNNPRAVVAGEPLMQAIPLPPARPAGSLKSINDLPDRSANPGAINPDVTQQNMATTIFVSGFTKTIRPSVAFTNALKRQQAIEYGYPPDFDLSLLEEDHIVPLEAGGAPHDPANLWPQLRTGEWGARVKDLTENAANAALRTGAYTLKEIQDGFCQDWKALHARLFSNPKVVGAMMMMSLSPPEDEP